MEVKEQTKILTKWGNPKVIIHSIGHRIIKVINNSSSNKLLLVQVPEISNSFWLAKPHAIYYLSLNLYSCSLFCSIPLFHSQLNPTCPFILRSGIISSRKSVLTPANERKPEKRKEGIGGGRKVQKEEKIVLQTRNYNGKNIILGNERKEEIHSMKNNIKISFLKHNFKENRPTEESYNNHFHSV